MTSEKLTPIMVPRENKGHYVQSSRNSGLRLQDWAEGAMNLQYDFDRFTLGIPALAAFEAYVLAMPLEQVQTAFTGVCKVDAAQDDAVADLKMVKGYLEKRIALANGWGAQEGDMQRDIALDMLRYFHSFPQTSATLMRVLIEHV